MDIIKEQLKILNKRMLIINLIGAPGPILIGLSLYAIFEANGDAFHPALNNLSIVYNMLIFGIAIEAWHLYKIIPLSKQKIALSKKINT